MTGILILGELLDGRPQPITGELISAGRLLGKKLGEDVSVTFLGSEIDRVSCESIAGIAKVYFVEDPLLASSQIDLQLSALEQMCIQAGPSVVLVGKTSLGTDIGPRLAFRMGVGIAHDCIEIDVDSGTGRLVVTRPVYGGNVVAKVTFTGTMYPQIAIIRQKVYKPSTAKSVHGSEVVVVRVTLDPSMAKSKVIRTVRQNPEGVRLEDADVVVAGGRGLGGPMPFDLLKELARLLDGAMAASGAACSAGWIDHGYKVGLTGKTIAPNLYIAVGISGASQHMAGCAGAKHVVAINRDANANIFKVADFGVVGDWGKILPSFMESVREMTN